MLKPFSTGKLDAHEAKWKIMQDNSQKRCQIRKAHIHFICKQLGLDQSTPRIFQVYSLLQKTSDLLDSELYSSWNVSFNFSMTCLLTHYFKYLLRLPQCQITDESTMKQERVQKKKKKSNCCSEKY